MKRFITGVCRTQGTLFPEALDDFISEENVIRVVEAFIDEQDLESLGFDIGLSKMTGRPGYHPATLLKLYVYGYLNRIQSSRRLEREAQRNVELMWLTQRLSPDFKTIADFRKNYGSSIQKVCKEFVVLCRHMNLFADAVVAVDGSKFKAVNSRDNNYTVGKLRSRMERVEEGIRKYLDQLDAADRDERQDYNHNVPYLQEKLSRLRERMRELKAIQVELEKTNKTQISYTDPDSRSMTSNGMVRTVVGYNTQAAVDTKHHLIVAHEVTTSGSDRDQLFKISQLAKDVLQTDQLDVLADRGYYSSLEIKACEDAGIRPHVPKTETSANNANGKYDRKHFIYLPDEDQYLCPGNEKLKRRVRSTDRGRRIYRYWSSNCALCKLKSLCTAGSERRVSRWEYEDILDRVQARLDANPHSMRTRKSTVEHPFGTIKSWMGSNHFLTRRLENVSTEMSLHVLAYNMKRVINILGVPALLQAIRA